MKKLLLSSIFLFFSYLLFAQSVANPGEVVLGDINFDKIINQQFNADRQIKFPKVIEGKTQVQSATLKELETNNVASLKTSMEYMNAWKKMDNEGFATLIASMSKKMQTDPQLAKNFRVVEKAGVVGISIGDPNVFIPLNFGIAGSEEALATMKNGNIGPITAAAAAFLIGYSIGTACFKSGWCDLSK